MAKCTLDLSHPHFQKCIKSFKDDPDFQSGLEKAKAKIEENHASCNHSVQPFYGNEKFKDCHNKVWKYDWAPDGSRGSSRKAWRLIVIVPDPLTQPYRLIAARIYSKTGTAQLSLKELALIFMGVVNQPSDVSASAEEDQDKFRDYPEGNGVFRSLCCTCGETVGVGDSAELERFKAAHECSGPI